MHMGTLDEEEGLPARMPDLSAGTGLRKCIITGAAGFIGSHLVERLLADENTVTSYDNLSLGRKAWVEHLLGNPRFTFIQAGLLDLETLKETDAGPRHRLSPGGQH